MTSDQQFFLGRRTSSMICVLDVFRFRNLFGLVLAIAIMAGSTGCHSAPTLPDKSSREYGDVVSAFYVGLGALQVGDDVHADSRLSEVTQLVPAEPAGWANWGVLALRQRNYDTAAQRLDRARDLAPQNDQIYDLLGILESQRGQSAQAIADLRKAVELNPKNLRALYRLAEETERQGDENGSAELQQLIAEDSGGAAGQSGGIAGVEPDCRKARRCCDAEVGGCPNQRPLISVASRSAAATCGGAGGHGRHGSARRPRRRPLFCATC